MIESSPASFVVRIDIPEYGSSAGLTGFLVSSEYLITCAHAAVRSDSLRETLSAERLRALHKVRASIRFDDGLQVTGTAVEYALPDCALVRLDRPVQRKPVRLVANFHACDETLMSRTRPCAFGFALHAPGGLMKSPVRRVISSSQPFNRNDLFDFQIDGGLPMGMSGSPVLVETSDEWLSIGMVYLGGAGSATSRLVSSHTLLEFLKHHGVDCLAGADVHDYFPAEQPEIAASAEEQRRLFMTYVTSAGRFVSSNELISLPDVYVHRTVQEEKIENLIEKDKTRREGTWISVQGHAGSGKSSLLWCLQEHLSKIEGTIVQPFAAQYLSDDFSREETIVSYKAAISPNRKFVVLIDTLDLIVGRGDRALASFIASIQARGVSVVTTCRPLEAQRLFSLHVPGQIVPLGRYSKEESIGAVSKYVARAYPGCTQEQQAAQEQELWNLLDGKRRVQELSFEPLILRMIFEVYPPDPIPAEINTALVYSSYWAKCVIRDRLRVPTPMIEREHESFACRLADTILFGNEASFSDAIKLSEFEIAWQAFGDQNPFPHQCLDSLKSSGVIEESSNGSIRFFHQTLLEFAAARHIVHAPGPEQRRRLDRIISDLQDGVFLRAPVLVQIAVQDAQAGGKTWLEVLNRLLESGSESACYLSLEILGKTPENGFTAATVLNLRIVERWSEDFMHRLAECAVDTVGRYPKPRIAFGLSVLEFIVHTEKANEVFALAERLASIDPRAVLDFLRRTLSVIKDQKFADDDLRGHYKSALLACAEAGEVDAIRTLADVFSYLSEGQLQGVLTTLAQRVNHRNTEAVGDFLRAVKGILWRANAYQIITDYLDLLTRLHRISPSSAVSIANDLLKGTPRRLDDAALLKGWITGGILKTEETIPCALKEIISTNHLKRLTSATTLSFADAAEQDEIIDNFLLLDLPGLTDAVRGSLFDVVASLQDATPEHVMKFISSCTWPENKAGKAWRSIAARLTAIAPGSFVDWLLQRLDEHRLARMVSVGLTQLLLAQPALVSEQDVRRIFKSVLNSDIHCLGSFAQATGAVATVNPGLASEILRELIKPRHCGVWAALAFSLHYALRENRAWVLENAPYIIAAAVGRSDHGVMSKLLEAFREWPEDHGQELVRLLEENVTEDVLKVFPQEKCQVEYLVLIKTISRAAPNRAFELLRRAVIQTPGSEGGAAIAAANIARHTEDETVLKSLLDQLLRAAPNSAQRNTRFAIQVGLASIDEKVGHRYVIESFFSMYKSIEDPGAKERLISAVQGLPSWTSMDTERLLADLKYIKGAVRSHVLKLKKP